MNNTCVCCGETIPEGRQICPTCSDNPNKNLKRSNFEVMSNKVMTKDEFIKNSCSLGYCNAMQAEEYCKDRTDFTDDDYVGVYQMVEAQRRKNCGRPLGKGSYTTKRYLRDGGEGNG